MGTRGSPVRHWRLMMSQSAGIHQQCKPESARAPVTRTTSPHFLPKVWTLDAIRLFDQSFFMPHGHCYLWTPWLLWANLLSDVLIAGAYFAIPIALLRMVRRRTDLPFDWMFLSFGVFIVACGTTHLIEAWNIWHVDYWLLAGVKVVTAVASVPTAILLFRLIPRVVALPSPAQLATANAELLQSNHRLADSHQALESFSYSVSHDLRAPLRSIDGFSQALQEEHSAVLDAEGLRYLARIRSETQRMDHLIQSLLNLSRVAAGGIVRSRVDLSAMARAIAQSLSSPERVVNVEISPGLVAAADPALAEIVLQNLLENAFKFTGQTVAAEIRVGVRTFADGRRVFYVSDNGAGFDPEHAGRLFGTFERLHSAGDFPGPGSAWPPSRGSSTAIEGGCGRRASPVRAPRSGLHLGPAR